LEWFVSFMLVEDIEDTEDQDEDDDEPIFVPEPDYTWDSFTFFFKKLICDPSRDRFVDSIAIASNNIFFYLAPRLREFWIRYFGNVPKKPVILLYFRMKTDFKKRNF
jgi:hypothetical protein